MQDDAAFAADLLVLMSEVPAPDETGPAAQEEAEKAASAPPPESFGGVEGTIRAARRWARRSRCGARSTR